MRRLLCTYCGEEIQWVDDAEQTEVSEADNPDELVGVCEECRQSIEENDQDLKEHIRNAENQHEAHRRMYGIGCLVIAILLLIGLAFDVARWVRSLFSIE
jgi:hypothetical protein